MPSEALAWMLIAICMLVEGLHNRNYRRHVHLAPGGRAKARHMSLLASSVNGIVLICEPPVVHL